MQTACENTAAATTAGLAAGMNAVELDVSVSRDNVVFLWSDPMPADPIAQARTLVSIKVFVIMTFTCVILMYHVFSAKDCLSMACVGPRSTPC